MLSPPPPPSGRVLRPLKDGYWDATEVLELADGSRRVRKRSKPSAATAGPWGLESLRREIRYLRSLPPATSRHFPRVLEAWELPAADNAGAPTVGYDMPFFADHRDAGSLAAASDPDLDQAEIDRFQHHLAQAVLADLHAPATVTSPLSRHFDETVREALTGLDHDTALRPLLHAASFQLNGESVAGPQHAWEHICRRSKLLQRLDAAPMVRLHGDLFLENILWRPDAAAAHDDSPPLLLIDPVSVAGISAGPALFDLVKYVSYASGELFALRSEGVTVGGMASGGPCTFAIDWETPGLAPFRRRDWYRLFRDAFVAHHGPVDRALYHLIDGYFSAAMALNTRGLQRQARLLKATQEFHRALQAEAREKEAAAPGTPGADPGP